MSAEEIPAKPRIKVVIFGAEKFASLAWYVLTHDSPYEVVGFTVDAAWCPAEPLHGLPVVPFEEVERFFPPQQYALLISLGWKHRNALRAARYSEGRARGYSFVTYVSSRALVWPDLQVGENAMIYEGANVQPFARIGQDCILRNACNIGHHATIGDHVFLAAHAVVGGGATVGERCFLGLNSAVRDGVVVAPGCVVAAGALITADTESDGLYVGVPARRRPLPDDL